MVERVQELWRVVSLLDDTNPILHYHASIASQKPHLPIPSHRALGLQQMNLVVRRHTHSEHRNPPKKVNSSFQWFVQQTQHLNSLSQMPSLLPVPVAQRWIYSLNRPTLSVPMILRVESISSQIKWIHNGKEQCPPRHLRCCFQEQEQWMLAGENIRSTIKLYVEEVARSGSLYDEYVR